MVSSTPASAPSAWGAWGSQPAPLDPLLTRIRSGAITSLVLFSSQRIRLDDWPRLFDALADAEALGHPVTSLSLSGHAIPQIADEAVQRYMTNAKGLTHLAILAASGVDADLEPWAKGLAEAQTTSLASLDLSGKALAGPVPILTQMLHSAKVSLEELVLYGNVCPQLDFGLVGASAQCQFAALTTLDLASSQLTPVALRQWVQSCPNLRSLIVSENPGLGNDDWIASAKLDHLESVDLSDCAVSDQQFATLLDPVRFPKLTKVLVAGGTITGSNLSQLSPARSVQMLSLARCPLSQDFDGKVLSRVLPVLETLDLGECRTVPVATVADVLKHSTALKGIVLRGVSCVGLENLLGEGFGHNLVDLDLTACELSLTALKALIGVLPSVQVWQVGMNPCCDESDNMMALEQELAPRRLDWQLGQGAQEQ